MERIKLTEIQKQAGLAMFILTPNQKVVVKTVLAELSPRGDVFYLIGRNVTYNWLKRFYDHAWSYDLQRCEMWDLCSKMPSFKESGGIFIEMTGKDYKEFLIELLKYNED